MESNKPLSVHMTHQEYAKYLAFKEDAELKIRYDQQYYAMCHQSDAFSKELNAKDEAIKELLDTISKLENKPKRRWYQLWN